MLKTAVISAELLRRAEDGSWPEKPQTIVSGELTLESIGFSAPLAAIYRTTHLPPER
ncbi:MAG TPA: hypothetical protein VFG05_00800 [Methylocella sp.]|nr:hypothetical protein [Methylocella sp.]